MCDNVKCETVGDDKQCTYSGHFPNTLPLQVKLVECSSTTKWLRCENTLAGWQDLLSRRLMSEVSPVSCARDARLIFEWPGTLHSQLSWHLNCLRSVPIQSDHSLQELKLWGSNLPEETPQAFVLGIQGYFFQNDYYNDNFIFGTRILLSHYNYNQAETKRICL